MPASPKPRQPKSPPPPKPWRREDGAYRSSDDRFTIENGGGRWFLTDAGSLDELGLARTLGPFDTLDDAKAAAAAQRDRAAEESPLAGRLAATKDRPARSTAATADAEAAPAPVPARRRAAAPIPEPARPPEPAPPPRTWLDELEDDDRETAVRARRMIGALARMGVDDADGIVRRDVLGRQPAVATALLGGRIAAVLADRLEPGALVAAARTALPGPMRTLGDADQASLAAYAAFVAARVLDATLGVVAGEERAEGAGRELPGWRLVERPADGSEPRRVIVTASDVRGG